MIAMFGVTGTGLHVIKGIQNGGKKPRWGLDQWDRVSASYMCSFLVFTVLTKLSFTAKYVPPEVFMMDRDRRLTGDLRGQIGNHEAPPGFELNNPWRVGLHPV
ncbi:hypothetical protein CTA2_13129 [Colletotrichum tanaceti]|uniref:NADH dehydrogenase [ubiquinone] 1 alpha subcomplex subunit 1 n=1 Tax=Colletotrichum tanaceti TaxID=1306861 RepID=A0A4U6XPV7_9PEZI|nr:hypothetical protein CTA2_13129 [Colletotrichum tanaceti]TKW57791.1 hypothetical protein CTA1_442 [Colletotrichum tanaceti]